MPNSVACFSAPTTSKHQPYYAGHRKWANNRLTHAVAKYLW